MHSGGCGEDVGGEGIHAMTIHPHVQSLGLRVRVVCTQMYGDG